ncbi:DUF3800 domain-containing protein [Micromonospora sp. ALFpr18c]|uniref:DUF3800 domain-containing protein n=1 Tax=Micromonospora sp. ALFpr18c TaxID=1458665 RepID=UPI001788C307|nr:DUF3800 domain-containing protein [Micromonospora sp. ALFpr18c]
MATYNFALYYVDDSGSEVSGYTTYSWIKIDPVHWAAADQQWLAFRAAVYRRYGIPASARLHATDLAGGRGRPGGSSTWKRHDGLEVIREGLWTIATLPGVRVGSVYRRTQARGSSFREHKQDLYRSLVDTLDRDLGAQNSFGLIVMDGDGSDPAYARSHRSLGGTGRRLIEDPCFRRADVSQWVQIADFAAWSAYRSLRPDGRRTRPSSWYRDLLGHLDVNGGPIEA